MSSIASGNLDNTITALYPDYYAACKAGRLFHATQATTGVALLALGTTAGFALANPLGTKVEATIIAVRLAIVSGTFVVGSIYHGVNTNVSAAAVTGTAITAVPGYAGSGYGAVCKPFTTATIPANQTPLFPLSNKNATAATGNWFQVEQELKGEIILAPGATWSLYMLGTDTTPVEICSVSWIETPLIT